MLILFVGLLRMLVLVMAIYLYVQKMMKNAQE